MEVLRSLTISVGLPNQPRHLLYIVPTENIYLTDPFPYSSTTEYYAQGSCTESKLEELSVILQVFPTGQLY